MKLFKKLLSIFKRDACQPQTVDVFIKPVMPAESVIVDMKVGGLCMLGLHLLDCSPGNQQGKHGDLIGGLGAMGDAIVCTRCGRDKYQEHWTPEEVARAVPCTLENMPQVHAARALAASNQPDNLEWLK